MSDKDSSSDKKDKKRKKSKKSDKSKDKDKKKEVINEKRTYDVVLDDRLFNLKIEVENNYLRFTAHEICGVYHQIYKNKYELEQIIKRLNLVKSKYTSFTRLIKFFDTAYSKNKIYLEQKPDDEDLYIAFIVPVDFEEEKYLLHLRMHKLDDSEVLPMLMDQINRLNNNNAIVKNKFNEIERQIDTISKKNGAKLRSGTNNNINKELDIIKRELYDINGKLNGSNKLDNLYGSNNGGEMNILKSSNNKLSLKYSTNNFKSKISDSKNDEKLYFNNNPKKNKKYNNQRYDEKIEDEKEESFDMYINNNNKSKKGKEDSNKKKTLLKSSQKDMNDIKRSLKYINNKEEQKYDENEIKNLKGSNTIKFKKENNMIINNDDNNSNEEEENDSFNNNNNIKLRGGKRMLEISNSNIENNLLKKETPKILYVNKNPSELEDYKKKTKVEYESAPINLNYKEDITKNNTSSGWNDMFEVYISYQNNNAYLASPNRKSYNIDIFLLEENRKETSLKGHKNNIRTIRYFLNKDKKENQKEENKELIQEYLISADDNKIVIVWDVLNQFEIKQLIDTNYEDDIYSCALFFNKNTERNYIVTSTYSTSSDISNSATKLYSLATGEYGYYIKESNFDNIYYLLIWLNPKDQQNYLIQFSFKKIVINNLEKGKDEIYAKLIHEPENEHYSGYLFSNENSEFLCTTSYNGFIHVWNLYTKKLSNIIDTKIILCHIIQWNEKFAIAADFENKSFVIIDLDEKKIFKGKQIEHKMEVKCVKKIMHSELGECLITAGRDHTIKLWAL